MTNEAFQILMENRFKLTEQTLMRKGNEYSVTADRLDNFKRIALMTGSSPTAVLMGFAIKHIDSVIRLANNEASEEVSIDYIDEKIGDTISYLILLEALLNEGRE